MNETITEKVEEFLDAIPGARKNKHKTELIYNFGEIGTEGRIALSYQGKGISRIMVREVSEDINNRLVKIIKPVIIT